MLTKVLTGSHKNALRPSPTNSEANATEFLGNLEDIFKIYKSMT